MSGLGRFLADQQRRADASMLRAQLAWDNRAPDDDDEDELTSLQPLGDTQVSVAYVAPFGVVSITGAWLNAEFVDEAEFSRRRLDAWQSAIQRELDSDAADHAECARLQDALDREAA